MLKCCICCFVKLSKSANFPLPGNPKNYSRVTLESMSPCKELAQKISERDSVASLLLTPLFRAQHFY